MSNYNGKGSKTKSKTSEEYRKERRISLFKYYRYHIFLFACLMLVAWALCSCKKIPSSGPTPQTIQSVGQTVIILKSYLRHAAPDSTSFTIGIPKIVQTGSTRDSIKQWSCQLNKTNSVYHLSASSLGYQMGNADSLSIQVTIDGIVIKKASALTNVDIFFTY